MIRRACATLIGLLAALGAQARPPIGADMTGDWVVTAAPSNPGVRLLHIARAANGVTGTITSDWYGELPMLDVTTEPAALSFSIYNGNPRIARMRFRFAQVGSQWHLTGAGRRGSSDAPAHRATGAELARLTFHAAPLPPLRELPDDGLARTPPMGWSSWNKFEAAIDDVTVRATADAMVRSGLRDAGYHYVNIDDGWQGARDAQGILHPNARFPDMKALADYVHARGLKIGIYSSPGPKTCAGFPGSYGHAAQDAKTFAAWGIDYLKYDLCSGEGFFNTAESVRATYQEMGAALRATGRPIVYSLCEYGRFDVGAWGRKVGGHLWRTTRDITDDYGNMAGIGFESDGMPDHAGPGGWNDPDMLEIGNGGMTADEERTHLVLWAMQAAPLMLGNDLTTAAPATLALLSNRAVIVIDQDRLGVQGRRASIDRATEVWTKMLADGTTAVALFNRADKAQDVVAVWRQIGLADDGAVHDVWTGTDTPHPGTNYTARVPARGVVLLIVRPPSQRQIVG
ncbi:glycoside hydrolase family 27 protein [Sphingomonas nostoxanthinifaciens]|uniref:glycoside hydrolase family 27 protein n=1 Tax=Sphingomonas nostoxanthinifaciens TaxID=2872652 RepID=UPI001CC1E34F|nr:glycoside hydrolase family 27 protein [Sphingomonas nostoxanthinifaciens]UAK23444.1 glycoside hydrolase family 27 protein [Sphingomonas nostoxanthinifaciens]